MKPFLLALASLALLVPVRADTLHVGLDGTKNVAPPAEEVGPKDDIARIKEVPLPQLEIYPAASQPSKGTILISPGGGYSVLAVVHEGRAVAAVLNEAGWDAAVLLYHVSAGPETRDLALADAKKALDLLQKRGAEFGLNSQRVGAMGFSAGGHLTARLGHETAASNPPQFLILVYPAYLDKEGKLLDEVTPLHKPTFLYVAANDKFHTGAVAYDAACKEAGIPHEFYLPAEGGHGFGLKKELHPAVKDWPDKLKAFLGTLK